MPEESRVKPPCPGYLSAKAGESFSWPMRSRTILLFQMPGEPEAGSPCAHGLDAKEDRRLLQVPVFSAVQWLPGLALPAAENRRHTIPALRISMQGAKERDTPMREIRRRVRWTLMCPPLLRYRFVQLQQYTPWCYRLCQPWHLYRCSLHPHVSQRPQDTESCVTPAELFFFCIVNCGVRRTACIHALSS